MTDDELKAEFDKVRKKIDANLLAVDNCLWSIFLNFILTAIAAKGSTIISEAPGYAPFDPLITASDLALATEQYAGCQVSTNAADDLVLYFCGGQPTWAPLQIDWPSSTGYVANVPYTPPCEECLPCVDCTPKTSMVPEPELLWLLLALVVVLCGVDWYLVKRRKK